MAGKGIPAKSISGLEDRIGYTFRTHDALKRALTHSSAAKAPGDASHYERLEFLGDRVLGLCVAQMLYESFPKAKEGELSVRLNALVSGKACAETADALQLHEFIQAGSDVKKLTGKRMRSVRADVVESLIAAIYLDGGLESASAFVSRFWSDRLHDDSAGIRDSKTALQEWAHAHNGETPKYTVADRSGPDHEPIFQVTVVIEDVPSASGRGRSKRAAEQAAAESMLIAQKVWEKSDDGTIRETEQ